jgi:hypothetical protein
MKHDVLELVGLLVATSVACGSGGDAAPSQPAADSGAATGDARTSTLPSEAGRAADAGKPADAGRPEEVGTLDAGAGLWVYADGSFNWPLSNDYSYAITSVSYTDTTGVPLTGAMDVKIVTHAFGGWQPAAGVPLTPTNWDQDVTGMTHLTFALKPTAANQTWKLFFHKVGDVLVYDSTGHGETVDVNSGAYGPAKPLVDEWSVYSVPLSEVLTDWDAGGKPGAGPPVLLTHVYKFAIADATGATQTWFIDNVGFVP